MELSLYIYISNILIMLALLLSLLGLKLAKSLSMPLSMAELGLLAFRVRSGLAPHRGSAQPGRRRVPGAGRRGGRRGRAGRRPGPDQGGRDGACGRRRRRAASAAAGGASDARRALDGLLVGK